MYLSNEPMGDVYLANFNDEGRVVIDVIGRKYLSGGYLSGDNYEFGLNADGVGVALPYYKDIAQPDFGGLENVTKYFVPIGGGNYKDSDNDGLYDVQEEQGMMLSNGKIIKTDPQNRDTDGDGLSDGEEMGKYNAVRGYYPCYSNPLDRDTDDDGYEDGDDTHPRVVARWTRKMKEINEETLPKDDIRIKPENVAMFQKLDDGLYNSMPVTQKAYMEQYSAEEVSVYDKGLMVYNFDRDINKYSKLHNGITKQLRNNGRFDKNIVGAKMGDGTYIFDTDYIVEKVKYAYVLSGTTDTKILLPIARMNLYYFLDCTGTQESIDVESYLKNSIYANMWYETNMGKLYQHIEDTLKFNGTMTYVTEYGLIGNRYPKDSIKGIAGIMHDYGTAGAYGQTTAAIVAYVSNSDSYIKYRYIIYDYYDWDFDNDTAFVLSLRDCDLFAIESCGFGKSFYISGEIMIEKDGEQTC